MSVDVYLNRIEDRYNEDQFFIESCYSKESKELRKITIRDIALRLYFDKNNYIRLNGKDHKYCKKDENLRKMKVVNLSTSKDDQTIKVVKKIEDTWEKTDW